MVTALAIAIGAAVAMMARFLHKKLQSPQRYSKNTRNNTRDNIRDKVSGRQSTTVQTTEEAGTFGGSCTCPDGQVYQVGDNHDNCGSLACVGGVSGPCNKYDGEWSKKKVVCGTVPMDPIVMVNPNGEITFLKWNEMKAVITQLCNNQRNAHNGTIKIGNHTVEAITNGIKTTGKLHVNNFLVEDYDLNKSVIELYKTYRNQIDALKQKKRELEEQKVSYDESLKLRSKNITDGEACLTTKGMDLTLGRKAHDDMDWLKVSERESSCVNIRMKKRA